MEESRGRNVVKFSLTSATAHLNFHTLAMAGLSHLLAKGTNLFFLMLHAPTVAVVLHAPLFRPTISGLLMGFDSP